MAVKENTIQVGGDLYYVTDDFNSVSITAYDPSAGNADVIISELEALNYESLGYIGGFNTTHIQDNENEVNAMNCNVGTFQKTADKLANINFTMLELNNLDALANIIGSSREAIAWTPVAGATQATTANAYSFNQFIKIANQNADGSAITVNSVTGGTDGLLVVDTDYYVGQNANGEYGIFIIDSATVTTMNQVFTIDYDYTPAASEVNVYNFENADIPFGIYKFESCAYQTTATTNPWRKDIIYMYKVSLWGEIVERYLNTAENLEGSEVALSGDLGGLYLKQIKEWPTMASVS